MVAITLQVSLAIFTLQAILIAITLQALWFSSYSV